MIIIIMARSSSSPSSLSWRDKPHHSTLSHKAQSDIFHHHIDHLLDHLLLTAEDGLDPTASWPDPGRELDAMPVPEIIIGIIVFTIWQYSHHHQILQNLLVVRLELDAKYLPVFS